MQKAWELLDSPNKWTQGACARDASGAPVMVNDPNAVCWCPMGAMIKCYPAPLTGHVMVAPWRKLQEAVGNVPQWNDTNGRTYEEVFAVLRRVDV